MSLIYWLILLLIYVSIAIGLFIFSKRKKSIIGLAISVIIVVLVILTLFSNTIDQFTISKNNIITDLKVIDIELYDDFEITNNKVTGMPERIQETELQISQNDKDRIINEIKTSANFTSYANEKHLTSDSIIFNFKYPEFYSRETYQIIDNIPTIVIFSIYDNNGTVKYQRIED